jgi:hypothetical protein
MVEKEQSTFDLAAIEAKADLDKKMEEDPKFKEAVILVATWWKKWYMSAGHRHLGRIIKTFG